ncbi:MAG: metalloregulator ArsR/SmtB family transcription factor [Pseudomonadota bacterium]
MDNQLAFRFQALGDPTRLAVVEALLDGPAAVSDLAAPHAMALPSFTKHLGVLERAGLIRSEKRGRVRTCRLAPEGLDELHLWFADRRAIWTRRLDRLDRHLRDQQES